MSKRNHSGKRLRAIIDIDSKTVTLLENNLTTTEELILEWIKKVFTGNNASMRYIIMDHECIVGMRKELGDKEFYEFIKSVKIICSKESKKYINKFTNEYGKHLQSK